MSLPSIEVASLFDIRGKSALIVGATGAFGKVACAALGSAGARLTIAAGNAAELSQLEGELKARGISAQGRRSSARQRSQRQRHCRACRSQLRRGGHPGGRFGHE